MTFNGFLFARTYLLDFLICNDKVRDLTEAVYEVTAKFAENN